MFEEMVEVKFEVWVEDWVARTPTTKTMSVKPMHFEGVVEVLFEGFMIAYANTEPIQNWQVGPHTTNLYTVDTAKTTSIQPKASNQQHSTQTSEMEMKCTVEGD